MFLMFGQGNEQALRKEDFVPIYVLLLYVVELKRLSFFPKSECTKFTLVFSTLGPSCIPSLLCTQAAHEPMPL